MEGQPRPPPPPPPRDAAAISAVLDDDDLLDEILVRVAFPTTLVRAALVCKRWLRHASAPAFPRRFRGLSGLHPPRLLGFYIGIRPPRFVAMPQPPEIAAVVRRASFDLDTLGCNTLFVNLCWNGLLLITCRALPRRATLIRRVCCPLHPARCTSILPPVPATSIDGGFAYYDGIRNVGGDGLTYFYLAIGPKEQQTIFDVYVVQDGVWAIYTLAVSCIPQIVLVLQTLLGDDRIYSVALVSNIHKLFMLDLQSSCLSLVEFLEEVEDHHSFDLSLADDSGVHLNHVKGFQLRIWLHRVDSGGFGNWFLVYTICLREICANHMIPTCAFEEDGYTSVLQVHPIAVNSEFVFLKMDGLLYLFILDARR